MLFLLKMFNLLNFQAVSTLISHKCNSPKDLAYKVHMCIVAKMN